MRQENDDMWGNSNKNAAMSTLQSHLKGNNMSEMMGAGFQGSFNNRNAKSSQGDGGMKADPKFAQAKNKQ